jgi:Domain of unknown function (DUF5916)/Carbohydrate family 9 binding domain-like
LACLFKRILVMSLTIIILKVQFVIAQSEKEDAVPKITAVHLNEKITIDGKINEPVWQSSAPVTQFIEREPVEGAPAEEKMKAWVLYDESALYVGAIMYDSEPQKIGDQIVRRDEWGSYDYFEFSIDPNNDHLTGYTFRVSASGVQRDVYLFDDVQQDEAWDAVWSSAVHRDSTGWSAELCIPVSQLRYEPIDSIQTWGVNFKRKRLANNEETFFALESKLVHGRVSLFGKLEGLNFSKKARRLEIRPYLLGSAIKSAAEVNNPFNKSSQFSSRAGFDLRYGLGSDYTLDMTVNPDFGQVEVDPAEVNLTAFETFFSEKRPFFIEDAQIFDFNLSGRRNQLFYGRRIGREPRASGSDSTEFYEVPTQTSILGAVKLTGRSSDGLSIGLLTALTQAETGREYIQSINKIKKFKAEPSGLYSVVRARQDFRHGASQLGGIITGTHQNLPGDGSLDFINANAYSYGLDFSHNWGGLNSRDWGIEGHVAGSSINGHPEALTEVQSSSNHYFQRPDAIGYSLDSSRTSMNGYEWELTLKKLSGDHFTGRFWINEITPGFEVNDIGFYRNSERVGAGGRVSYQEIKANALFRSYEVSLFTDHWVRHNAFNDLSWESLKQAYSNGVAELNGQIEFLNYWGLNFGIGHAAEHFSANATRGGPLMTQPGNTFFWMYANSDEREIVYFEPSFGYEQNSHNGYNWDIRLQSTFRPSPGWEIQIEPSLEKELNPAQYVETADDPGYYETYGHRYIFAELNHQTISLETRLNIAFNPKLTIQLYAQSFITSGKYQNYKQLRKPESFAFDFFEEGTAIFDGDEGEKHIDFDGDGKSDFSFEDADFNIRSLKLNAVLRWEYLPGSTLFLVWQHSRFNEQNLGAFEFSNSLDRLWGTPSDNAVILKLNYWLDL